VGEGHGEGLAQAFGKIGTHPRGHPRWQGRDDALLGTNPPHRNADRLEGIGVTDLAVHRDTELAEVVERAIQALPGKRVGAVLGGGPWAPGRVGPVLQRRGRDDDVERVRFRRTALLDCLSQLVGVEGLVGDDQTATHDHAPVARLPDDATSAA